MVITVIVTAYHVTAIGVIEHFKYLVPAKGGETTITQRENGTETSAVTHSKPDINNVLYECVDMSSPDDSLLLRRHALALLTFGPAEEAGDQKCL